MKNIYNLDLQNELDVRVENITEMVNDYYDTFFESELDYLLDEAFRGANVFAEVDIKNSIIVIKIETDEDSFIGKKTFTEKISYREEDIEYASLSVAGIGAVKRAKKGYKHKLLVNNRVY